MLDLPRYLLGVAELALLAGFAGMGAAAVRARLLPTFSGAPAYLATAVLALALLVWVAEILGSFGLFEPVPYLAGVTAVGSGLWLWAGGGRGYPSRLLGFSPGESAADRGSLQGEKEDAAAREGHPRPPSRSRSPGTAERVAALVVLAIAAVVLVKFGLDVKPKLSTGMTGFDSTWYHGPFAAGFFQSGDTWDLHYIAPQFLAWFYPANAEIFHAAGMLAFGRDVLSPLLNLGWFVGCLVACWCIGKPYKVAPWSMALGAIALSLPVLSDQAGEARNDIVGIFFLFAAVAIALNALSADAGRQPLPSGKPSPSPEPVVAKRRAELGTEAHGEMGPLIVSGLAAGLAAGTKLNFVLPAVVLVLGLVFIAPARRRRRALAAAGLAALAAAGYWYLRNLVHTGNPLPWFDHIGPISLPAPDQALGGREGHSVLGYLTDGTVWSEWFLPGLHGSLTLLWPLLASLALAGLSLCFLPLREALAGDEATPDAARQSSGPDGANENSGFEKFRAGRDRALAMAGLTGIAVIVAWLIAPTSASGPEGMPRGFDSGLRYLAPALVLGLALLPATPPLRKRVSSSRLHFPAYGAGKCSLDRVGGLASGPMALIALVLLVIAVGYPVQRHYLENRYASPTFAAPGLNAAFKWADAISSARIATTSTRQYPLYGTDLSNHVQYIGEEQLHGGFVAPATCHQWRRLLNAGDYDYAITTRDRIELNKPAYPPSARWTVGPSTTVILRQPPTVVFKLSGPMDPSACP